MKTKPILFSIFVLAFSIVLFTSCKDQKTDNKQVSHTELHASVEYKCPMDCEDGKMYDKEGKCPVCKMGLKTLIQGDTMTCSQHKDGKCSCEGDKCECANCPEHNKAMTCSVHKEGKCSCEGDKCKCDKCAQRMGS